MTIFQKSQSAQHAYSLPSEAPEFQDYYPPADLLREEPLTLPEVSELDLTRHFTTLSQKTMGIDTNFYPLGSCTMKLNPRINEKVAALPGFTKTHPLAPESTVQGNLHLIDDLLSTLCHICGMTAGSLAPNAGAQGEFTALQMIKAYHKDDPERDEILIPDSAHGTNPASASLSGFKTVPLATNAQGDLDLKELKEACSKKTAGLMLTNPNTLGLFSPVITEIAHIVHESGGLLFYDGANLNPMLNIVRPGDMGFDVMHLNLHKTFSTPHGGGGPGSGPILCNDKLKSFLPGPYVEKTDERYTLHWERGIGHISSFHGNFSIYLRAYLYIKLHGHFGLRRVAEVAVLNANYLKHQLKDIFTIPFPQPCMHEFIVQADNVLDIAKRLLDYGIHPPTVYFPLIMKECMLIEPTETESKETLDYFVDTLKKIVKEDPEFLKSAPHTLSLSRLDEVRAAKHPKLKS